MRRSLRVVSAFYGPFREVAESAPSFGDRRTGYQMDPANGDGRSAVRPGPRGGADVLLVEPSAPVPRHDHGAVRRALRLPGIRPYPGLGRVRDDPRRPPTPVTSKRSSVPALEALNGDAQRASAGTIVACWAKDLARWICRVAVALTQGLTYRHRATYLICGGVDSPVRAMRRSRARRARLHAPRRGRAASGASTGTGYVDCGAVVGTASLRARRPGDARGRARGDRPGPTFGAPTKAEVELAAEIVDAVPSIEMVPARRLPAPRRR